VASCRAGQRCCAHASPAMSSIGAAEALEAFASGTTSLITPQLTEVLQEMASTGQSRYDWTHFRALLGSKLQQVCSEYYGVTKDVEVAGETFDVVLKRLLILLGEFPNPPFTTQRLCELLLDPHRIYATSTRKLMNAIEKLLTVSSTEPVLTFNEPKPGSYQAVAEYDLAKLASGEAAGDGSTPMDVET